MRFRHILISLPLLLCASQPFSMAQAATMNPTEATALLAKSQAIDVKCAVLDKDQSQALKDFVARAEISLAEKASVSVARKTIAGGRAEGKAAMCDVVANKLVKDVLAAATTAVAAPIEAAMTTVVPPTPAAAPIAVKTAPDANSIAMAAPEPTLKRKSTLALAVPQKPKAKVASIKFEKPVTVIRPVKGLGTYAAVAEKYYVASRCGTMNAAGIRRLYQTVLSNHQQALANNRPGDVRAMLRAAEARAGAKTCS
jgi:hypothetical protein